MAETYIPSHVNIAPGIGLPPDRAPAQPIEGAGDLRDHRVDDDHWQQPGDLFRLMTSEEKQRLFENTARQLSSTSLIVQLRHITNCRRADQAYGEGVARALNRRLLEVAKCQPMASWSKLGRSGAM